MQIKIISMRKKIKKDTSYTNAIFYNLFQKSSIKLH